MAMFRSLVASAQQRQPPGGPAGGDSGLEAQYSCPICLEVYHRPVAIGSCGHTFCGECLQPCLQVPSPLCPLCRLPFDPKKVDKAAHVEKQLSSYKAPCRGCSKKVTLAKMRVHVSSCVKVQEQMANCPKFVPVVPTSQPIPSAVPNRSTFTCPYCGARNLDQQELLKHCVDNHRSDPNRVVNGPPGGRGGGRERVWLPPSAASARAPCCRCAPSARRCPGGTPATRAPTSYSTCCTGTSSPTTPSWITASTRKPPSRPPWPCLCPRTEGTAQPLDLSPPASGHWAASGDWASRACVGQAEPPVLRDRWSPSPPGPRSSEGGHPCSRLSSRLAPSVLRAEQVALAGPESGGGLFPSHAVLLRRDPVRPSGVPQACASRKRRGSPAHRGEGALPVRRWGLAFVILRIPAFFYTIQRDDLSTFFRAKTEQLLLVPQYPCLTRQ